MQLLIKNGKVVDPESKDIQIKDVLIQKGQIVKVAEDIQLSNVEVIDADGLYLIPGLIDLHAHLREPGREDEEDLFSGSLSAIAGGFTTICCMPNTEPPIDNPGLVSYILEKGRQLGLIDILPIGAISKGRKGEELGELARMKSAGCVGFSDDGNWISNSLLMRRAMEYSLMLGIPLILHSEDTALSRAGLINEGTISLRLGLEGIPRQAEIVAVKRDLELAKLTGARIHITHLSCKEAVEVIRQAKEEGLNVTADTCPHYLILTESALLDYNTNAKVKPPLRTEEDRIALIQGLREGWIDSISTDHAPHSEEEKDCEFAQASFGMIGLETALALGLKLVEQGELDLIDLVRKLSYNPAKIIGLQDRGRIAEGFSAQIAILDPNLEWVLSPEKIFSRSKNTPFLGWSFKGKVRCLIQRGEILMENFEIREVKK